MSKDKKKEQELEEQTQAQEHETEEVSEQQTEVQTENEQPGDEQTAEQTDEQQKQTEPTEEEKLRKELDEAKDKYLRLMAEYDNFRKRSAKERLELSATVKGNTIGEILPVFDNFERALAAETEDTNYKAGVEMIFKQFGDMLSKLGVEIIDPIGQTFDPNIANAVNQIEDENYGENEVAQVFQKGYKIGDKVIRYAMVVVANP